MNTLQPVGDEARKKILDFVIAYWKENHVSPSGREIREGCGISSQAVLTHHLKILTREGRILSRRKGQVRSIVPIGMTISFQ